MAENKIQHQDPIPEEFDSLEKFWAFWDSHSTADYEDQLEDIEASFNIRSEKIYCLIAQDIVKDIRKEAKRQGISTETLVNAWLKEKIAANHT